MATRAHSPGAAPVIALPPVLAFIMGVPAATRASVEAVIEGAIEALDTIDGDPDLELNGDERDGNPAEDDFWPHDQHSKGAGCPISDPDMGVDDERCDALTEDGI